MSPGGAADEIDSIPAVCIGIVETKCALSAGAGAYADMGELFVLVSAILAGSEYG